MPPYSSSPRSGDYNDDGHEQRYFQGLSNRERAPSFTASVVETISTSMSKIQDWVDSEKSKNDSRTESYHSSLIEQEERISSQVAELSIVQRERGFEGRNGISTDRKNDNDQPENIAVQKRSLQVKFSKAEVEILKLKAERDNREKRVHDTEMEELKQKIRAIDAAALKRTVEESKKTTVDDLTRGVVNYKKLGLDFTQTGRDAELLLNFTEIDENHPLRIFSFVLLVTDDEKYDISNCKPEINDLKLLDILEELNESGGDDISILTRRMRRAFKEVCVHS